MIGGKHHGTLAAAARNAARSAAAPSISPTAAVRTAVSGRAVPGMLGGKHHLARTLAQRGGDARP